MNTAGIEIVDRVLVSYFGTDSKVVVDSDILAIADRAFAENKRIKSIEVNSLSLRTIGKEAFFGCKQLSEASFKAIKGSIGTSAFEGCSSLQSFVVPNGTLEICSNAFHRCAPQFILCVPYSTEEIGIGIVDKNAILVCSAQKAEIEEYAKKNSIAFRRDFIKVKHEIEILKTIQKKGGEKQFTVYGESISASSSLRIYKEILEYYQNENERVKELALNGIPTQLSITDAQIKAIQNALNSLSNETITKNLISRVERWGVILPESTVFMELLVPSSIFVQCINLIIQGFKQGNDLTQQSINDARNAFIDEAESRVTGLSYGMIGGGLDMVLYSIDDFRERQRQRRVAYAQADEKLQKYANQTTNESNRQFAKLIKETALPTLLKSISQCCDELCKKEISILRDAGVLVGTIPELEDIAKSSKIIESAVADSSRDKEFSIALALKRCPFNTGAYSLATKHALVTDNLLELFSYVGFGDEISGSSNQNAPLLEKMIQAEAVSVDGLAEFCSNVTIFGSTLSRSVSEVVKGKLTKLLGTAILPRLTEQYDGHNQQQITKAAVNAASEFVSKASKQKLSSAGISITDCASHIANEKISGDQAKAYDVTFAAINLSSSLSDDISCIKANEAVIGELSVKNLLQKSIAKCEKS